MAEKQTKITEATEEVQVERVEYKDYTPDEETAHEEPIALFLHGNKESASWFRITRDASGYFFTMGRKGNGQKTSVSMKMSEEEVYTLFARLFREIVRR